MHNLKDKRHNKIHNKQCIKHSQKEAPVVERLKQPNDPVVVFCRGRTLGRPAEYDGTIIMRNNLSYAITSDAE